MQLQRILGMAIIFAIGVGFGAVLGGWRSVSVEDAKPVAQAIVVPSTPAFQADPTYLGVRAGDVLLSVNGVKDASMFHALDVGIKRGNVCVTFERDAKVQEVCLNKPRPERTAVADTGDSLPSGVGMRAERMAREALTKGQDEEREAPLIDPETGAYRGRLRSPATARHLRAQEDDGELSVAD